MNARGRIIAVAAAIVAAVAFLIIAAAALLVIARRGTSRPQAPVVCQQYDIFDLSNGNLVPDPGLPLWLRHKAALVDHCPVSPPWGTLQSDHTPIS